MKAQHVVTGKDRDRAYRSIGSGVCVAVIGVAIAGGLVWWLGLIVFLFGVLMVWNARARLRGEI